MTIESMNGWAGEYLAFLLIGAAVLLLLIFVLILVLFSKNKKLLKKYQAFMSGEDGKSLENEIMQRFSQVDILQKEHDTMEQHIKEIDETLLSTYQKIGIVKYDAFNEMGGKLSFALVMLNDKNNGFVLNSMHSREGCYTYIKEIIKGESFVQLSGEEKEALQHALDTKNYMG